MQKTFISHADNLPTNEAIYRSLEATVNHVPQTDIVYTINAQLVVGGERGPLAPHEIRERQI